MQVGQGRGVAVVDGIDERAQLRLRLRVGILVQPGPRGLQQRRGAVGRGVRGLRGLLGDRRGSEVVDVIIRNSGRAVGRDRVNGDRRFVEVVVTVLHDGRHGNRRQRAGVVAVLHDRQGAGGSADLVGRIGVGDVVGAIRVDRRGVIRWRAGMTTTRALDGTLVAPV